MDETSSIRVFLIAGYPPSHDVIKALLNERVNLVGVLFSPPENRSIGWRQRIKNLIAFGSTKEPRWLLKRFGIPTHFTRTYNDEDAEHHVKEANPDLILLYGCKIIKPNILSIPRIGTLNAHSALLPKYRGGASEFWILFNKEPQYAGVTIHWVTPGLDQGDIFLQQPIQVAANENPRTLRLKARSIIGGLFVKAIKSIEAGKIIRIPQDETQATAFKQPTQEERNAYERIYGPY